MVAKMVAVPILLMVISLPLMVATAGLSDFFTTVYCSFASSVSPSFTVSFGSSTVGVVFTTVMLLLGNVATRRVLFPAAAARVTVSPVIVAVLPDARPR